MSGHDQEQPAPARPRDWLDDYFQATATPTTQPPKPDEPAAPTDGPPGEPEPEQARPWWSLTKDATPTEEPAPEQVEVAPGVHITVNQPQPRPTAPPGSDRRARARRWILVHGAGAGVGYSFGLYHSLATFLNATGPGAPAAGLTVAAGSWFAAEIVTERYLGFLPSRTRPAALWACRIPFSTALLATALHAPNPLI
ncbi:hypothetical protein ACFZCL_04250 [Streptomyces sp. NPDC008159]|uniref:hypothetical protein n=1 Tax=Streptomyces sp. NPDC008159 TaxID=3364817 RepID=UPI0036EFD037